MYGALDNFVKGVIVYIAAVLRAVVIGFFGIVRFRSFRSAVKLRMLAVSDPDFTVSGRIMLLLACMTIALVQRSDSVTNTRSNFIKMVSDSGELTKMFIASLVTSLTLDILITLLIFGAFNRLLGRRHFRRRKAVQRAEILRYLIASYIMFFGVSFLAIYLPPWDDSFVGVMFYFLVPLAVFVAPAILISFGVAMGGAYIRLIQSRLPSGKWKRRFVRTVAGVLVPTLVVCVLGVATGVQAEVVKAIFPTEQPFPVTQINARCAITAKGEVFLSATFKNPTSDWYYLDPSGALITFNHSRNSLSFEKGVDVRPYSIAGQEAGLATIAPKTSESFEFLLSADDQKRVAAFAGAPMADRRNLDKDEDGKQLYCHLSPVWAEEQVFLNKAPSDGAALSPYTR
jgi:hypothetical protein